MSSDFWLPWASVPQDGVEDREQLSTGGNDRHELGFPGGDEPVAELPEFGVEACGDQGSHEQDATHARSAATDEAFATPFSGLSGPWRKASQRGDLTTVQ